MPSTSEGSPRALVVCAGGGIGDSLLASVVGRALHGRFECVDALTLPAHRAALERVPDFDGVVVDDGDEKDVAQMLGARRYAAAVVTWATARVARIVKLARIPVRVGQARRLYSGSFTTRVVVRSERGDVTSHWTQVLLDYARALGCDTRDAMPRFVPTDDDRAQAAALVERYGLTPKRFVLLHPCNAIAASRAWPVAGWKALHRALRERLGVPIVVTGGSQDAEIARCVADGDACLAGETGIGAFGALAAQCKAFVGITTGTMHVAAAVGAPTVGIFPFQTDFPERWAPLGRETAVVRPSFPCHRGDTKERCADYACIEHLDVSRIVAAASALLQ